MQMHSAGYLIPPVHSSGEVINTNNHNSTSSPRLDGNQSLGLWNTSLSSSDSSGSWTQGTLPPPPQEYNELSIQPSSVPLGPAKPWDSEHSDDDDDDDDDSIDEDTAGLEEFNMDVMKPTAADSDSCSELESESECTTEIFIPKPGSTTPSAQITRRGVSTMKSKQRHSDVIPSVSSDNICHSALPVKVSLTSEEIATNIDSGISNETSNVHSHEGTVIQQKRTRSVSSSSHYSSSYSCGSRGQIPSPTIGNNKKVDDILVYMREAKVSRVVSFLSACYAALLMLLGVIFPVFQYSNRLTSSGSFETQLLFLQVGFYIYLYGLSIFFLIYVYATVVKDKHQSDLERKKSLTYNITAPGMSNIRHCISANKDIVPMIGSLFLRVSVVLFCVGSLIDNSLKFGMHLSDECDPSHTLKVIQPLAQAIFMFFETYFIFNNTKMCIRHYPIVAKFGIMHLIATNVCIWVLTMCTEINTHSKPYRHFLLATGNLSIAQQGSEVQVAPLLLSTEYEEDNCTHNNLMVEMANKAKPYTYPCTLQFAMLVTCILYVMWRHVDTDSDTQCSDCKEHAKRSNQSTTRTIDCSHTTKGLLLGILTLIGVISSLIAFFMLSSKNYYDMRATLVIHNYQIAMYLIMTIISVAVLLKLRALDHNNCKSTMLEDMLLIVCVLALFTHDVIGIISGIFYVNRLKGLLVLATSIVQLLQSVVQMSCIIMGLKLCIPDVYETSTQRDRPGRECVTFLIVANFSLWVLSLFNSIIGQNHEIQVLVVGQLIWGIVLNVVNPFVMFYHLYSASCFIDIWYNAYRLPSVPTVEL